jgi:Na+/melibiose symporter-like transporter
LIGKVLVETLVPSRAARPLTPRPISYALGNLGKAYLWTSFETVLLFYLVSLCGMPAKLAGDLLGLAMVVDSLIDLTLSYAADRWPSQRDKRLLLFGLAPLCGLGFTSAFLAGWWSGGTNWSLMIGVLFLCRIAYSACDIIHNALLRAFSDTDADASVVSGFRFLFSSAGAGLVAWSFSRSVTAGDPEAQRAAFAQFGILAGALYAITVAVAGIAAPRRSLHSANTRAGGLGETISALWRHTAYRKVVVLMAVQAMLLPMFNRALPFFGIAWRSGAAWAGNGLLLMTIMQAASLPFWMMAARAGLRPAQALRWACALFFLAMVSMTTGLMDVAALMMAGAGFAGANMAVWAILGRIIRLDAIAKHGLLLTPIGVFLAALKASSGLGNILLGWIISGCGGGLGAPGIMAATIFLPALGSVAVLLLAPSAVEQRPPSALQLGDASAATQAGSTDHCDDPT